MSKLEQVFDLQDPELASLNDELSLWAAPFGLKLLDAVNYRKNITALDIGFGTGFPLLELAMRLGEGSRVYGIDPWSAAVERVRTKIAGYGIKNVEIIEGRAESLKLPDQSIDLIVSNNGINNVDDLARMLAECSRVSKPGAQFLATMNLDTTMIEFYSVMEETLRANSLVREVEGMKRHIYSKRKPLEEVTSTMEKNRFKITNVAEDQFAYEFSSGSAMLNHRFIRLWFLPAWKDIIPPDRRKEVFEQIESKLNMVAETNGCLTLTVPFALIECEKT